MSPFMRVAERELRKLIEANPITKGMDVRTRGENLTLSRADPPGPFSDGEPSDRVRFTHLGKSTQFGLSVLRHTGRWEKVPFQGTLGELVEVVSTVMQHLVAPLGPVEQDRKD
jgi:hypothetical protein